MNWLIIVNKQGKGSKEVKEQCETVDWKKNRTKHKIHTDLIDA